MPEGLMYAVDSNGILHPVLCDSTGAIGGSSVPHDLLDGSVNQDTLAGTVARGDVIIGDSTPKWSRLAKGTANQVLSSNGTDISWGSLAVLLKGILTANGDILYRDNSGNVVKLAKGNDADVLTLASGIPTWAAPGAGGYTQGCRVYSDAVITCATGAQKSHTFNLERYDTDTMHDNVTNNTRITIKTAGVYSVGANMFFVANSVGLRVLTIMLNDTVGISDSRYNAATAPNYTGVNCGCVYKFAANDYITCDCYQDSGGNLNTVIVGNRTPEFWAQRVG
jgi:hypothetical protein